MKPSILWRATLSWSGKKNRTDPPLIGRQHARNGVKVRKLMKNKTGLSVNPAAGMGGSIGLKGTEDQMYNRVTEPERRPVTPHRSDY